MIININIIKIWLSCIQTLQERSKKKEQFPYFEKKQCKRNISSEYFITFPFFLPSSFFITNFKSSNHFFFLQPPHSLPSHRHRSVFPFLHVCCFQLSSPVPSIRLPPKFPPSSWHFQFNPSSLSSFLIRTPPPPSCQRFTPFHISIHLRAPFLSPS